MTARDRTPVTMTARPRRRPGGFTLLEVLVSLGIIIGALAGIAALLPAAGSRLAEANDIDRAGTMAANARADLANRGLIAATLWQVGKNAVVFGEGLLSISHPTVGTANVSSRIDPTTGFQLRDVVQTTVTGSTVITGTGYEPGICYGCMLSSTVTSPARGSPVRVTTVVFRKLGPEVKLFALQQQGSSSVFTSGNGANNAADRRRFLAGCSWVLVVGGGEPRWVQIASSWTAYPQGTTSGAVTVSATGASCVSLTGTDWAGLVSSGTLQVFGFDGLLQLDERFVNLE